MLYDERVLLDASIVLHKLGLWWNRDYCHFVYSIHTERLSLNQSQPNTLTSNGAN